MRLGLGASIVRRGRVSSAAGGGASPSFIGGDFKVTQSGTTVTLTPPVGAQSGDLVIAVLRARADRTMSGFSGWTQHRDSIVQSTLPSDPINSRVYILSRVSAGEASYSFTHSAAGAYGAALLVFRDSAVVQEALADGYDANITKAGAASILLAVGLANNDLNNPSTAANPTFSGYTRAGVTYFDSAGTYFYTAYCETRTGVSAGLTGVSDIFPSAGNQNGVWLAEIG